MVSNCLRWSVRLSGIPCVFVGQVAEAKGAQGDR